MRVSNLLVLLVACAAPKPVEPLTCPPPPPAPRGLQGAADLTEAQVKERSHAFLDAFDRASVDDIQDALAPSFVWYEEQGARDKAGLVGVLQRRTDRHAPIHSRTYKDEHVYMSGNAAVFIGESIERMPPNGDSAAVEDDGSNTLVWVRSGTRWQLVLWQWGRAGIAAECVLAMACAGVCDLDQLEAAFKVWKILRADHVEGKADWLGQPKTQLVRFVAEKPRVVKPAIRS